MYVCMYVCLHWHMFLSGKCKMYTWTFSWFAVICKIGGHFLTYQEVSGLLSEFYTVLYTLVHWVLSAAWISRASVFQGQVYIGKIGQVVRTIKGVRIIKVSTFHSLQSLAIYTYIQKNF